MKKSFSTRKLCFLSIYIATTVLLAIYATFRIGNQIKIPFKFLTVFMIGAIFGPWCSGFVAGISDILNSFLVPVGPWIPQITIVEFLYGLIFGLFFYKAKNNKIYYMRVLICSTIQFLISILYISKILTDFGYFYNLNSAIIIRMPSAIITFFIHIIFLCIMKKFIFKMKNFMTEEEIF